MRSTSLIGLWLAACGTTTPTGPEVSKAAGGAVTLVHTARMEGELEPCG